MRECNLDMTAPPGMLDAAEVARGLGRWVPLGASIAENWRRTGRIVGVRREGGMVYPACQFDEAGLPFPEMQKVIHALQGQMDAEGIVRWLHQPCSILEGQAPCAVMRCDPAVVLLAAQTTLPEPLSERRRNVA